MDNDSVRAACAADGEEGATSCRPSEKAGGRVVCTADGPTKKPSVWRAGVKRG